MFKETPSEVEQIEEEEETEKRRSSRCHSELECTSLDPLGQHVL